MAGRVSTADGVRDRIFAATYACVARYGLAKTTVEDAAREAKLSRATLYRYFPGGKEQLVNETVAWEAVRFFARLAEAIADAPDFASMLEEALIFAHRAIEEHEVLQKVLVTDRERLTVQLTVGSDKLVAMIAAFLAPALAKEKLRPGLTVEAAADYLARLTLSFISTQGRWDLTDRAQVRDLVQMEFLAGIGAGPPPTGAGASPTDAGPPATGAGSPAAGVTQDT
jgi:AcrR family transcriptional regulator